MNTSLCLTILALGTLPLLGEIYPNLDDPLEKLVYRRPVEHYDETDMRAWETAIAKFPAAKEKIFLLFERDYRQAKNWELISFPLAALALQPDLKSEDLDRIEKEMSVAAGQQNRSQLGSSLLAGGVPLLVLHPTPEREALIVRLARDHDWFVTLAALRGLVKMGSKEAKVEVGNAIERRRIPGKDQSLDWLLSEITSLLSSLEVKAPPSANPPPVVQPTKSKAADAKPATSTPSEAPTSSTPR